MKKSNIAEELALLSSQLLRREQKLGQENFNARNRFEIRRDSESMLMSLDYLQQESTNKKDSS